jgi:hypothetical protein
MTNSQIAEQIVCMTEGEVPMDVLGRLVAWDDETWQQCDPERNARQLTQVDRLEIIQFVAGMLRLGIKSNEGRTKTRW